MGTIAADSRLVHRAMIAPGKDIPLSGIRAQRLTGGIPEHQRTGRRQSKRGDRSGLDTGTADNRRHRIRNRPANLAEVISAMPISAFKQWECTDFARELSPVRAEDAGARAPCAHIDGADKAG